MKAWTFQYKSEVTKKGDKANWYAGWIDPEGKRRAKSFGPGERGKAAAEKHATRVEVQVEQGTYESKARAAWAKFKAKYKEEVINTMELRSGEAALLALNTVERILKPGKVSSINAAAIQTFISRRAFATMNAASMDLFTLQRLMQHKSLETTKLYVNMANRLKPAVAALFVPDVAKKAAV